MPRRPKSQQLGKAVDELIATLKSLEVPSQCSDLRAAILHLVRVHHGTRDLGVSAAKRFGIEGRSAFERIRVYLIRNEGRPVSGDERRWSLESRSMRDAFENSESSTAIS